MNRHAACLALALWPFVAGADARRSDANLVTGIDISESVSGPQRRAQLHGLAAAIRSPAFLAMVGNGAQGRVGIAVFAWHHGSFPDVVRWRLIEDAADAEAVARAIEARIAVDVTAEARVAQQPFYHGRLTDISGAIDHAAALLDAAPYAAPRGVINIVGEGEDNVGDGPAPARDRLVAAGATVNGVVMGADPAAAAYYRHEVAGGPGSFVIAGDGGVLGRMMERKFLLDLIALAP